MIDLSASSRLIAVISASEADREMIGTSTSRVEGLVESLRASESEVKERKRRGVERQPTQSTVPRANHWWTGWWCPWWEAKFILCKVDLLE